MRKWWRRFTFLLLVVLAGPMLIGISGAVNLTADWRTASRESAGIAPDPVLTPQAVIQIFGARAFGWRGLFAVHTWIAVKDEGAQDYRVHQVLGWNAWYGHSVVDSQVRVPDRYWYGAKPELIAERRGDQASALIADIESAVKRYPYPDSYRVWPGPNSNTFVAFVAREVPALRLALPATAIGKDYLVGGKIIDSVPSGTGMQLSVGGAFGVLAAKREGLEINLFGAVFGLDPLRPALKLPGIGRIGMRRPPG